jgi:hypothetical protein
MPGRRVKRTRRKDRAGLGTLLLGFVLTVAGGYLLTNQVEVSAGLFGGFASFGPNSFGVLLIPLLIGVALLCFSPKLLVGRLLTAAGAVILLASVLDTLRITFRPTSLFITLLMLGLLVVGIGLMARSVVGVASEEPEDRYELEVDETTRSDDQLPLGRKRSLPSAPAPHLISGATKSIDEEILDLHGKKTKPDSASPSSAS